MLVAILVAMLVAIYSSICYLLALWYLYIYILKYIYIYDISSSNILCQIKYICIYFQYKKEYLSNINLLLRL